MDYQTILTPLVTATAGYLVWLLRSVVQAHVTPKRWQALAGMATNAVTAVDQLDKDKNLGNAQRYELAAASLVETAKRLGVKLSPDEVQTLIHAGVRYVRQMELS